MDQLNPKATLGILNQEPGNIAYCQLIASNLKIPLTYLPNLFKNQPSNPQPLLFILVDDGNTNSVEYNEFTDKIRSLYQLAKIIIAIPVIPSSETQALEASCDTLIYLHADPYYFSVNQFYQNPSL